MDDLRALLLVWGSDDDLRLVPTVREALGAYPAGLGRPAGGLLAAVPDTSLVPVLRELGLPPDAQPRAGAAVAAVLRQPARVEELIASVAPDERDVLDRLAAGPPVGRVRPNPPGAGEDVPPARRLVTRGLLVPLDAQTVELPREVGLVLRGPHPLGPGRAEPPKIDIVAREPDELDRVGSTAVLEALRLVDALADAWTAHPPAQLRAGGVGVRELRRSAKDLGIDEPTVALVAEVAAAAGLLNSTHAMEPAYLPTDEYDAVATPPAAGPLGGPRDRLAGDDAPAEPGQPARRAGPADHRPRPGRGARHHSSAAPAGAGRARRPPARWLPGLAGHRPRSAGLAGAAPCAWPASARRGDPGRGGPPGRHSSRRAHRLLAHLLSGSRAVAEQVLGGAIPAPVDYFLVQPDLTLVVPGPPAADLAAELGLIADLESTGGGSVYRITESSVRRALDAGRSGTSVAALIAQRSRTPVPQALQYLVDDLARRHGALRTGLASAYLRCDDESLLTRAVTDRNAAELQLRRIAPTVAISSAPVGRLLEVLREAGYAPAAEDPDGSLVALGEEPPRAPSRPPARPVRTTSATDGPRLSELVQRIRSGDALTELTRRSQPLATQVPGVTSAATMGTLRAAIREGRQVLLGLAGPDGVAARHTISPISMAGGFVRGHAPGEDGLQAFPLHRITAVTVVAEPDADTEG